MCTRHLVILSLALAMGTPALAQSAGTLELGAFGRVTFFDSSWGLDDRLGGGGWLGLYFNRWLSLEGEVSINPTEDALGRDVTYAPFRARLVYHQLLVARLGLLAGAGYVHNAYAGDVDASDNGLTLLLSGQWGISQTLTLRLETTIDYMPSPANGASSAWNTGIQLGLSFWAAPAFAGRAVRTADSDGDGIRDRDDRCPATPAGSEVDDRGCRLAGDTDADGVADDRDACPSTPAGSEVDARGCRVPQDADGDGVEDAEDRCRGTPAGVEVDESGCPVMRDSDGDGVPDERDICPATPSGTVVDPGGCPLSQDADGDGVSDPADACPDTPPGAAVDAEGCSLRLDADGDGVSDPADACPNTPAGTTVDAEGCPLPLDADGDGVSDERDACPATGADVEVDARGCPLPVDADGDGVPDGRDACPDTPAGASVDAEGCRVAVAAPAPDLFPAGRARVVLEGVSFQADTTYELTARARDVLNGVAAWLQAHPEVRVEIAAHSDASGFRPYAMIRTLGQASAVRRYLMGQGVAGARLMAKGYGPDEPVASNDSPQGRAQNRRVELRRLN